MPDRIDMVHSVLATTGARWAALASIDPGLLARQPAAGEWSAIQYLQHMLDIEHAVCRARVLAIRDGQDFDAFDPDAAGHVDHVAATAPELAGELARMRIESLVALDGLEPADLDRTARHAELGIVSLRELLNEWAAHDTMHIVQAERALMQAFIPGSGPWRASFVDHDVDAPRG
jgi:hypothetical protein